MEGRYGKDRVLYAEESVREIADATKAIREMILEAADAAEVKTNITSFQMHRNEGQYSVMSRTRSRNVCSRDLFVLVDPLPSEFAFVGASIAKKPHQRELIVFTSNSTLNDMHSLLSAKQVPLLIPEQGDPLKTTYRSIRRTFAFHFEEDPDKEIQDENIAVVQNALRYPHNQTSAADKEHFTEIKLFTAKNRESQSWFRARYLEDPADPDFN